MSRGVLIGTAASVLLAISAGPATADWGFEKVTPDQKGAASVQTVEPFQVAPDGQSILHTATAPYAGVPSGSAPVYVPYLAHREGSGWVNRALAQPMNLSSGFGTQQYVHAIVGTSDNLRYALVGSTLALTPGAVVDGSNLYRLDTHSGALAFVAGVEDADYSRNDFVQRYLSGQNGTMSKFVSNDGASIVFEGRASMAPDGIPGMSGETIVFYRWTADDGLDVLSKRPSSEGATALEGYRAGNDSVSAMGTRDSIPRTQGQEARFAFTPTVNFAPGAAHLWEDGETRPISLTRLTGSPSEARNAEVRAVSDDGRFVLLASEPGNNRLTDDTPVGWDAHLYRYDAELDELDYVGTLGEGPSDYEVLQMSHNGRSVAFISNVVQAPGAQAWRRNLYVWRDGELKFVSAPDDEGVASTGFGFDVLMSEDGRYLAFNDDSPSLAQQFGFDNVSEGCAANGQPTGPCQQVYRFDADAPSTDALECLSCRDDGQAPAGASGDPVNRTLLSPGVSGPIVGATMTYNSHVRQIIAGDGTVFFTSADDLIPSDANGDHDAYAYRDGRLQLLSRARPGMRSRFVDASRDGKTVVIATNDPITQDDKDRAVDLYVTGEGRGFEFPPEEPEDICLGGDCRGPWPGADPPRDAPSQRAPGAQVPPRAETRATVALSSLRLKGRTLRATVRVNGPGRVRVSGRGLRASTREVKKAGRYRVTVRLTSKSQRTLKRNGRLSVRARVSVSPPFGRSAVKNYRRTVRN